MFNYVCCILHSDGPPFHICKLLVSEAWVCFLVLSESTECVEERSYEVSKDLLATCLTCSPNAFRSDMPPISPTQTFSSSTLGFTTLCQSPAPVVYVWHLFEAENAAE